MEPKLLPHAVLILPKDEIGIYKAFCTMIYLKPNRKDRDGTAGPIPTEIIGKGESSNPEQAIGTAVKDCIAQVKELNNPKCVRRAE